MAPVKSKAPASETPKVYTVRPGFVVHRERTVTDTKNRVRTVTDIFSGDDPDSNEVELTEEQYPRYAHQVEELVVEGGTPDGK